MVGSFGRDIFSIAFIDISYGRLFRGHVGRHDDFGNFNTGLLHVLPEMLECLCESINLQLSSTIKRFTCGVNHGRVRPQLHRSSALKTRSFPQELSFLQELRATNYRFDLT
jgi:hypothetical protein